MANNTYRADFIYDNIAIAKLEDYDGEFDWDTSKPNGTPRKLMDSSLVHSLGWEPKISLRDGIRSTYGWFAENSRE